MVKIEIELKEAGDGVMFVAHAEGDCTFMERTLAGAIIHQAQALSQQLTPMIAASIEHGQKASGGKEAVISQDVN